MKRTIHLLTVAVVLVAMLPEVAHAYIGPGAGFALAGSFLAVFMTVLSAVAMLLTWPIRWIFRTLFRRRPPRPPRFKRVVILGLDGLDHGLTETLLAEGKLPHLAASAIRAVFGRWPARCRQFRRLRGRRFKPV